MKRYLHLILMAAGNGRRYGGNKLLAEIAGKPMYRHVFDGLAAYWQSHAGECQVIVVSEYPEILEAAEAAGFIVVRNEQPDAGISLTIQLGIEAARQKLSLTSAGQTTGEGAIFFTADQPFLRAETLTAFITAASRSEKPLLSAAGMAVSGQRLPGNPVFFDAIYFPELLQLTGDTGGRTVFRRHPLAADWFAVDPAELRDIDQRAERSASEP